MLALVAAEALETAHRGKPVRRRCSSTAEPLDGKDLNDQSKVCQKFAKSRRLCNLHFVVGLSRFLCPIQVPNHEHLYSCRRFG